MISNLKQKIDREHITIIIYKLDTNLECLGDFLSHTAKNAVYK